METKTFLLKSELDTLTKNLWKGASGAEYLRFLAKSSAEMYSCLRPPGAAGAMIITADSRVVFGYVLPTYGSSSCKELGKCEIEYTVMPDDVADLDAGEVDTLHQHCVRTIHAEHSAILTAARWGVALNQAVIYSVLKPCYQCSKAIITAGIKTIYYAGAAYDEDRTKAILSNAGVTCEHIEIGLSYGKQESSNESAKR